MSHLRLTAAAVATALAGALASGCAGRAALNTSTANGEVVAARWSARLLPQADPPLGGKAVIAPASGSGQMVVVISMQGPPSLSASLGWRLERGACGMSGTLLGSPGDYPPVTMRADGTGESTATLDEPVPTDGVYRVRVFSSTTAEGVQVACGDFRKLPA